jgi:hypothetical protein
MMINRAAGDARRETARAAIIGSRPGQLPNRVS